MPVVRLFGTDRPPLNWPVDCRDGLMAPLIIESRCDSSNQLSGVFKAKPPTFPIDYDGKTYRRARQWARPRFGSISNGGGGA